METRWLRQLSIVALVFLFLGSSAFATSSDIVISQVYSSQFTGAFLQRDFIELFNSSSSTVSLTGWTLQSADEDNGPWTSIPLSGTIGPGQYYLIAASVGAGGTALPSADLSSNTTVLDPVGGRLAIRNDSVTATTICAGGADLVDFVAYGSSSACQITGPALDKNDSIVRLGGGCTIADGASSFSVVPPYPRSSSAPPNVCGAALSAARESFTVPAGGGTSVITTGTNSTLTVGSGQIQPGSGSGTPSGVAIFGFRQNNTLISEAGVPAANLVQNALMYVEVNGAINTGIAITNPNNQDVTLNFQFNDANRGYYFPTHFGSLVVPANGQLARFISELPYAFSGGIEGTLQITASAPVGIVVLRGYTNERGEFLVTTLPVIDLSAPVSTGPTYMAHFAAQGGWSTQVVLVNNGGDTAAGTVSFTDPTGQPLAVSVGTLTASSYNYSIPSLNSQSFIVSGTGANVLSGSINLVNSSGSATPVAIAVFAYVHNGVRVSEAGLVGNQGTAFRTYVEASGVSGAIGSIQSGLAIANTTAQQVTVNLNLTGLDGSAGLSTSISLPASGQAAKFLNELFPSLSSTFKGIIEVTSSSSISMVGLRGRYNERDDFLITTIPPISESASTSNQLVFPHFADSGGYTTQFILFGPSGQASTGNLLTLTPGGQPLPLQFQPN